MRVAHEPLPTAYEGSEANACAYHFCTWDIDIRGYSGGGEVIVSEEVHPDASRSRVSPKCVIHEGRVARSYRGRRHCARPNLYHAWDWITGGFTGTTVRGWRWPQRAASVAPGTTFSAVDSGGAAAAAPADGGLHGAATGATLTGAAAGVAGAPTGANGALIALSAAGTAVASSLPPPPAMLFDPYAAARATPRTLTASGELGVDDTLRNGEYSLLIVPYRNIIVAPAALWACCANVSAKGKDPKIATFRHT